MCFHAASSSSVQTVFLTSTSALRRKVQSGYQRQMANSLTALRMMHLLEDNSSGKHLVLLPLQFHWQF